MATHSIEPSALEVPLTQAHVDAANALQRRLAGWKLYEGILRDLAGHFPSNCDLRHVLPKAITLNSLYATGILAIHQMAEHIVQVATKESDRLSPEFADRIALLTDLGSGRKTRRCLSFASKYCHFFVSPERFAILDAYAVNALVLHMGKTRLRIDHYASYLSAVDGLIATAGLRCSYADLDHYLWLAGQRISYQRSRRLGKTPSINREVLPLFAEPDAECAALIERAFGALP